MELDSDMVDITQEPVLDSVLEESMPEDQEPVSASTHIASSLGINPHVLQVTFWPSLLRQKAKLIFNICVTSYLFFDYTF